MILGVRILSTNLSGLTGNVTFTPISGATIDLGEQTIPFNYLNGNPYGTYDIYIPLYDYTYQLVVNEPTIDTRQSYVALTYLTGTTQWNVGTLNYYDLTAELITLSIDETDWYLDSFSYTNESGYVYYFNSQYDSNDKYIIFTDSYSNVIDTYSAYSESNNYYYNDGFGFTFMDYYNGKVIYFDGFTTNTFEWDNINQETEFLSFYDECLRNRSILLRVETYSSSTYSVYIFNSSGSTLIDEYDYTQYQKTFITFKTGSFILKYTYDIGTGYYTDVEILSQIDGSILDSFTLPTSVYTYGPSYSFYGINKLFIIFYNPGDSSVPYHMYYYNGDTDVSDTLIKTRGSEYYNLQYFTSDPYNNPNIEAGSMTCMFWDTDYGSSFLSGITIGYMDIVYIIDGTDSFTTYTYQDSGLPDKSINIYSPSLAKTFYTWGNTGDGDYSVITIGQSGVNYFPLLTYPINNPLYRWTFGDFYLQLLWTDNQYTGGTMNLFGDGVLLDTMFFDKPHSWYYEYKNGIFIFDNYVNQWYVNNTTSGFTSIDYYSDKYFPYYYWTETGNLTEPGIILLNSTNGNTAILTSTYFQTGTTLPINGGNYDIRPGRDKFLYVYNQPNWLGKIVIELYDYNFNLLNSQLTDFSNWNFITAYKDRYAVKISDNLTNSITTYMVSETTITSFVSSNDEYYYNINDYFWGY